MRGREFPAGAFLSRVGKEAKGYQGGEFRPVPLSTTKGGAAAADPLLKTVPGYSVERKFTPRLAV